VSFRPRDGDDPSDALGDGGFFRDDEILDLVRLPYVSVRGEARQAERSKQTGET
jgi:hypothetical protein